MLTIAERSRDLLVPFLVAGGALLGCLLAVLLLQRGIRALADSRRQALLRHYRPLVSRILAGDAPLTPETLRLLPRRHRGVFAELLLSPLRVVRGEENQRARELAGQLGLTREWRGRLATARWWRQAEAALALGLVRDTEAVPALIALLDDDHEQVRAAAVDALGIIGDSSALAPLVARLRDPARHERARVVEALRSFGVMAAGALVEHGEQHPAERAVTATVLGHVGGASAADPLLAWTSDADAATR